MKRRRFIQKTLVPSLAAGTLAAYSPYVFPSVVQASHLKGLRIYQYASKGPLAHSSNTYFLESPEGVFIIDAQWTLSEAQNALRFIRQKTNKPFVGLLITHDHTDHYGGTRVFVEAAQGDLPIYASRITQLSIKNDAWGFQKNRKKNFGDDFPEVPVVPNTLVGDGETIALGHTSLKILERPNNEATSTTLVFVEELNALVTGDIVYDKTYAIFREGLSGLENWKQQLESLKIQFAETKVHPGHGNIRNGKSILEEQIQFLLAFRDPILKALDRYGQVPRAVKDTMKNDILRTFPEHRSIIGLSKEKLIDQSIDWLAAELDKNEKP